MKLKIVIIKDYNNEANMRNQRDSVISQAEGAGFTTTWTVEE